MDRSKVSAATSNLTGDSELASFFQDAMRLGDSLPPMQEQRKEEYHVETSLRYAGMQRHAALPALPPALQRRMSPMMKELQAVRQLWPQTTQPAYYPYKSSSPVSSSSHAGQVRFAATSYAFRRYIPTESVPPASSEQMPYTLSGGASHYQPSSSTITSQYYQRRYAVPDRSSDALSVPDYIRGRRSVSHLSGIPLAQTLRQPRTLEETRSVLLSGALMDLQLEGTDDDRERIRVTVLAGVRCRVHDFMDSREGHEVLVALLRACAGRHAEVHAIVHAALGRNPNGRQRHALLRLTKHGYWETCLKELMTAAAPYHNLCAALVHRFLSEGVMEHTNGDQLLRHCFATMPYQDTMVLVQHALSNMGAMLESVSGSKCLVECYAAAQGEELRAFQETLLTHAHIFAMGEHSNYFMQHALEHGDVETRRRLLDRLVGDGGGLVELALDCYGSYVAEACF
ncbi:hypothetical protein ACQ4PT_007732 [Festuca glaucescens]